MSSQLERQRSQLLHNHAHLASSLEGISPQPPDPRSRAVRAEIVVEQVQRAWAEEHDLVFVAGVGDGTWIERFQTEALDAANSKNGLCIIEPNASRLLKLLEERTFDAILTSPFVIWIVGEDWAAQWMTLAEERLLAACMNPTLFSAYEQLPARELTEHNSIGTVLQRRFTVELDRLRRCYADVQAYYAKTERPIRRVWFLNFEKSRASTFVMRGLAEGMRALGIDAVECCIESERYVSARKANWGLLRCKPDMVVTSNQPLRYSAGPFADGLAIPQAVWLTDAPLFELSNPSLNKQNVVFCFDRYYIPDFSARIGRPVHTLQAAATLLEPAEPDPSLRCQVSVVASVQPIEPVVAPFGKKDRDYILELAEAKALDRAFDLEDAIEKNPPPGPLRERSSAEIGVKAYVVANALYRRWGVRKLAGYDLALWGGDAWLEGEPENSPIRRAFRGYMSDPRGLAALYRSSAIHVSLHSVGTIHGLNMHAWNAPLQETFLLTENLNGSSGCFEPGEELACFDSLESLPGEVDRWLADPEGRRRIASAGRERVLRDHTFPERARRMLETVSTEWNARSGE